MLYPLNDIRARHPDVYEREIAKYRDHPSRAELPRTVIGKLNCLWNDVLHCSPIHPHLLYRAWRERGANIDPDREFYRIPISQVAHLPVAMMKGREVEWLDKEGYSELDTVPVETLEWYERMAEQGLVRGSFVGVPHVLVKGPIDISGVEVVRWGTAPVSRF